MRMATSLPALTLGIEEEYQIVDPETRELKSYIQEILEQGRLVLHDQIKAEFLQSQVEVGSHVCRTIDELRSEVVRLRREVCRLAESNGLRVVAASTHPFSSWVDQEQTIGERYTQLRTDMAELARRMLIFGTHVHVGIDDQELMIDVMNQARYFLPHLLALSTSSPFWHGRDTGLKSYRTVIFESLPRTGLPPQFRSMAEYREFVDTLIGTGCIDEPTKIWWDVRPHPKFPTLEFRVCDICTRVDEAVCLAALVRAICGKLIKLRFDNQAWRPYRHHLITENKWRAVRYGIDGRLIDFGKRREVPTRRLMTELLDFVDDVADELGVRREVAYLETILAGGTSADRQRAVYRNKGSFEAVVDHLVAETREGCD
ncbi:MAG: carboxylate-amine ligase [Acidobacteria bacterium]|nr:MAG: carboxylate-amine ligase [Acidobacteriota bacterium]